MAIYYTMQMNDESTVNLTLNLGALFDLSRKEKALTDRYFELYKRLEKNDQSELEMAELIYIAYRAANIDSDAMELSEFLHKMTDDRREIAEVFKKIFGLSKKKQGSQMPSRRQHEKR